MPKQHGLRMRENVHWVRNHRSVRETGSGDLSLLLKGRFVHDDASTEVTRNDQTEGLGLLESPC